MMVIDLRYGDEVILLTKLCPEIKSSRIYNLPLMTNIDLTVFSCYRQRRWWNMFKRQTTFYVQTRLTGTISLFETKNIVSRAMLNRQNKSLWSNIIEVDSLFEFVIFCCLFVHAFLKHDRWVKYVLFGLLSYLKLIFEQMVQYIGRK